MTNNLWFTKNEKGYCARFEHNEPAPCAHSGYLINPESEKRVAFPALVEKLASGSLSTDFYDYDVDVSFDDNLSLPIPLEEQDAIQSIVSALGTKSRRNRELSDKLQSIKRISSDI